MGAIATVNDISTGKLEPGMCFSREDDVYMLRENAEGNYELAHLNGEGVWSVPSKDIKGAFDGNESDFTRVRSVSIEC